jgi:hypothetical protein
VVKPNDPHQLSTTFQYIYNDFMVNKKPFINSSREVAVNLFAKDIILEKYFKLFEQ